MIRMVARSSMERSKRSAGTFKYAIILTKVDKVKRKDLEATIKSVNSTIGDFLTDSSSTNGTHRYREYSYL